MRHFIEQLFFCYLCHVNTQDAQKVNYLQLIHIAATGRTSRRRRRRRSKEHLRRPHLHAILPAKWKQCRANLAPSMNANSVTSAPPSSETYTDSLSAGYSKAIAERAVLTTPTGGSFFGSAVHTNTSSFGQASHSGSLSGNSRRCTGRHLNAREQPHMNARTRSANSIHPSANVKEARMEVSRWYTRPRMAAA